MRNPLQRQKKREPRSFKKLKLSLYIGIGGIVILYTGFAFLTHADIFEYTEIKYEGAIVVNAEEIAEVIEVAYQNDLPFFLNNSFFIYASQKRLEESIMESIPRVASVNVIRDGQILHVKITERKGTYLWCGSVEDFNDTVDTCDFIDSEGVIFDVAPKFSGVSFLRFFYPDDRHVSYGRQILTERDLEIIKTLDTFSDFQKDFKLQGIVLIDESTYHLVVATGEESYGESPQIILRKDQNLRDALDNLFIALQEEPLITDKESIQTFEYIDLRFKNRVIYKPQTI